MALMVAASGQSDVERNSSGNRLFCFADATCDRGTRITGRQMIRQTVEMGRPQSYTAVQAECVRQAVSSSGERWE
jgi:hypothetical protein